MILVLKQDTGEETVNRIRAELFQKGCVLREMNGAGQHIIVAIGRVDLDPETLAAMKGVAEVIPMTSKFKLVSRQWHPRDSEVQVGPITIGGQRIVLVAGPCAVESREQALTIAREVKRYGAVLFRAGAFKPRTSPYSFQGLEEEGLKILAQVREETGLPVVTEITSPGPGRPDAPICGHGPGGRPQHAELRTAQKRGPHGQTGPAQTGPGVHDRGVAHVGRIHHGRRQRPCRAVRAGHPHLRTLYPQHPGSFGHPRA
jgi:hypothetical protein